MSNPFEVRLYMQTLYKLLKIGQLVIFGSDMMV